MKIEDSDFRFCTKQELFEYICQLRGAENDLSIYSNSDHGFVMKDRFFTYAGRGYIYDNNFDYDAALSVTGDFINNQIDDYCKMIVSHLNTNQKE
jgi:hypothetical protein